MNIQQVKGEVGDGEEDITAESLTKYEKAAKDLGVALKEVKNGVSVLRDPMAVLNDLAEAFNKEADDSIKKANLINAIGGKYRGNQLAALLSNWETYKEILEDFNSDKALGSAVRESQKDVASWTGQVTILKNNWDAFINSIANSDTAIGTLKALNGVLEMLKTTSKGLGGFGTVSTLIAGLAGAKGSGILSYIQKNSALNKQIAGITLDDVSALRQYNALLTQGVSAAEANATALGAASASARQLATNANGAAVSEEVLAQAQKKLTSGTRAATIAMKALNTALNIGINMAIVAIISAIVKGLDKLIVTQKEAAQLAEEQRQNALDAISAYEAESTALNGVVSQYTKIISSTSDLSSQKEQLLNLQNQLPDSYKEEANGIDLVNGKISDNIALLNKLERKKADQYVRDNTGSYETAIQELGAGYTYVGKDLPKKFREQLQDLAAQSNIDGYNSITGQFEGTAQERLELYRRLRDIYAETDEHNSQWLIMLDEQIKKTQKLVDESQSVVDEYEKARKVASLTAQEYNLINQAALAYREYQTALNSGNEDSAKNALSALYGVRDIVYSMSDSSSALRTQFDELWNTFTIGARESVSSIEEVRANFAELSGEAFDNELKNIESIGKAIDSMLNDETLSHEDAWKLLNLDTEGVLSDIQLINGQYKLSTDQLVALMEQQINKQKESIETVKEAAQAEYDLLQAQLRRLKVNSPSDVATYKLEVERITDEMRDMQDVISGSDLLLQEVNGILGKTYSITGSIATGLSNAVKQFEAEVDAIDNAIDSLNDRKELIEKEKSALQEELELLNEQKETIEETLKNYDAVADAVSEYVKEQTDGIQSQIDALEEERKAIEDYYNDQIDALKEQNEERDDAIKKEKALADLANAQNQQRRVYSSARGWTYETSKEDVVQAQNALAEIKSEEQIKKLEKERDSRLGGFDDRKKEYETQIKAFEEYSAKYTSIASDIQKAENALLADQILGSNWREQIEQKDEGLLTKYRSEYQQFNSQLKNLVNNEISTLQASIDAKDKEIKMIDNEIKAYNSYKDTVQTKLGEAKTELENYKNNVADYCSQISDSFYHMQDEIWNNHNKIIGWFGAVAAAARSMRDEIGAGAVGGAMMGLHLAGFADGGVADSTGLAMLHGTKQKGEVIFNATDSKKLYELVHNTPSLIASVAKQAGQLTGANITNNNGSSTNSINVNIGQVVANNPREFTQNLDSHLDAYFRKKLTLSYTQ